MPWLEYCRYQHRGYCDYQSPSAATSIPGFKLIDYETRKLSRHREQVDYVALSYPFITKPAARVIEDVIAVTRTLGFKYLWIYRYCISQIDDIIQRAQNTRMHEIYADAALTIVAAAGEDPMYGLPSVSLTPRQPQPCVDIGDTDLVTLLRSPREIVMSSKWASRGWAFQEARLSRWLLFFTDDQILFECALMSCQEAVLIPLEA
ncbi:hypothetical protein BKA66DRAFT_509226 [Pyrenochaeta sp. MPI-SDFR-AT-0127]|nr:hypothetical protein BKA66DRAFT_509226 [Pyrenochaeta sp. MPI-SDFR-AT-0127]